MDQKLPPEGKGFFLIANGNLQDPHFSRKVVLLCDHNDKGSYGLVVNHPTRSTVSKVLPEASAFKKRRDLIYTGGPCERERVQVLHRFPIDDVGGVEICPGVVIGGRLEKIIERTAAGPADPLTARFFSGYSGWGPGQLAGEMKLKSWVLCPSSDRWIFDEPADALWISLLRSMGGYYGFLADMPDDPSVN